ncbi:MAG: iron-containing alcohol dehydrogenase [Streptococcaceae bacterium]|jgi:alcohol dehydrogenase class IV|nr:iron-containing alcohol dehydrogenase [Streptococcaceae bacterium]
MQVIRQKTMIIVGGLETLKTLEMQKVFVVADPFFLETSAFSVLKQTLEGMIVEVFSDIQPDPPIEQVVDGVGKMQEFQPDTMIAIGGGSAIDAAKAMKYFYAQAVPVSKIQFIAIPTTSGTGSEVTNFSIITDSAKALKYPLVTGEILPDVAILDKELTKTLPPKVTADTGMDVLTHCLEAFVSIKANDFSNLYAEKAFRFVFRYLPTCFKEADNNQAREKMHIASTLAGMSFNIAELGLNHGIAHAAGARFHIAHGRMNSILMPEIIAFNAGFDGSENEVCKHTQSRYAKLACMIGVESYQDRQAVKGLIREIKKLRSTLEMPSTLSECGIKKSDVMAQIHEIAAAALADATTSTNPRVPSQEDVERMIEKVC